MVPSNSGTEVLTSIPSDLADEILSINAIYGDATLSIDKIACNSSDPEIILLLSPPALHALHSTPLLLSFPQGYPQSPCRIVGPASVAASASVGAGRHAALVAQGTLDTLFIPGEACIFALLTELENSSDLIEERNYTSEKLDSEDPNGSDSLKSSLESTSAADDRVGRTRSAHISNDNAGYGTDVLLDAPSTNFKQLDDRVSPEEPPSVRFPLQAWALSDSFESHKSVFLARAVHVQNARDVSDATTALLELDRHVAKATHNIRAWRLRVHGPTERDNAKLDVALSALNREKVAPPNAALQMASRSREHQECDDDGEAKAGARVLGVMAAMDVWNVLVVVSRWYGGFKLGPERFRIIGQAARDVLLRIEERDGATDSKDRDRGKEKDKSGKKPRTRD